MVRFTVPTTSHRPPVARMLAVEGRGDGHGQGKGCEMHIVTLCCRDIATMATFYTRLGWRDTMPAVDNYFRFETGGALLALWPLDEALTEVAAASARPPEQFGGVTLAVMVPTREEICKAAARQFIEQKTETVKVFNIVWSSVN